MGTLEVTSGVDSFPAAKGHKPEEGAKVDGKDGYDSSHRALAALLSQGGCSDHIWLQVDRREEENQPSASLNCMASVLRCSLHT